MLKNAYHCHLCDLLSQTLHLKTPVKDSTLLQAYCTFHAIKATGIPDFQQAYTSVVEANCPYYSRAILRGIKGVELKEAVESFLQVSFAEFLRFGVPGIVCDTRATVNLLNHYFGDNLILSIQHIIQIRLTPIQMERMGQHINDSDSIEDVEMKLYQAYCKVERNEKIKITKNIFLKLYRAINQYPLDSNELIPVLRTGRDKNTKAMYTAIFSLRDGLGLSKEQQLIFLYRYFVQNENNPRIVQQYKVFHFTQVKDEKDRVKLLNDAMKSFASMYPLECLCAMYLSKGKTFGKTSTLAEDLICANDVTLENGLIYSLFSSAVFNGADTSRIAIFFPSPFFVRKWLDDTLLRRFPVTFVFKDDNVREIIHYHYFQGSYAQKPKGDISFISYDLWLQKVKNEDEVGFEKALLFACNWDITEQDEWHQLIKSKMEIPVEVFSLISSYEFENARSPFSAELFDPQVFIAAVSLIPQGINNSSSPRRKIFLRCRLSPKGEPEVAMNGTTKIYAFTLNTDLKKQALSRMMDDPVEVQQKDLTGLYDSIRKLFNAELLKRRAVGRSKIAAFSYEFSPDIAIWCSKSYPKNNQFRPRLEAYVCNPASQQKRIDGFLDRGKRAEETCKRAIRIPDSGITSWLEEEYPFSIVQARHNAEELKEIQGLYKLKPAVDIHDEIITVFGPLLDGQDIAIKTLWYLHPDLEDKFSGDDYRLLTQIAKTEIGYLRLSELTAEYCEKMLIRCFAGESQEKLWRRFRVLSAAVDQAIKYGYCNKNPLQIAIQDRYLRDKLFSQVRRALTKTHFTPEEMTTAYNKTIHMIEIGHMEYIGVLIRLLTGLESNAVCALRIKNFVEIVEYGIYQLNVTCQLTNDGSELKGFDRLEDYRNIPCMSVLAEYLKKHIDVIKKMLPDFAEIQNIPIATTKNALKKTRLRYKFYPPRKLDQLCKDVIEAVGIKDHIIEIPTDDRGTKETNLNQYGGDFFRENFRYWALNAAKLDLDEIQFILGNKPNTTFGRYYCDYLNDASQLMMFVKLQRWDVLLSCPNAMVGKASAHRKCTSIAREICLEGQKPLHLHIELMIRRGVGKVSIKISSKFGLKVFTTPIELIEQ